MTAEVIGRPADVASLLSRHRSVPVTVVSWEPVPPWAVARARLDGGPRPAERVIAKWTRPHANRTRTSAWRIRTELAALRFLSDDLALDLAPRALACDLATGLIVLTDLAPRVPLDQLLRADGSSAHATRLAAFARARGELHSATAGRAETYYARRAALGPVSLAEDVSGHLAEPVEKGRGQATVLGAPIRDRAERELATMLHELAEPGPFLALSNGDPEANNVLVHASGDPDVRLIDFEFAGYAHALRDAVCLHLPGPGWLWVRDDDLAAEYRRALARGVPEAEDDRRYGFGLAAACMHYALARLGRLPTVDARPPAHDSRPQLVATLEAAARTAEAHRALPHLAGWARQAAARLRRRWPDADLDLDAVPTYTPRRP
ncbi:phosphotransferase family enzyme [Nonomuraea polychroma]|uniref:Phosphotransferase family enzyme n=1 Tax=Nonomuraea polychroma TaxID=46176 RepID=A0A438MEB6_9ACTN|nr:phosphotransferase [Nonomuraea polychroma]RVX44076.1 phosphotransferase family enzyme [Nonomuraea polychroma]